MHIVIFARHPLAYYIYLVNTLVVLHPTLGQSEIYIHFCYVCKDVYYCHKNMLPKKLSFLSTCNSRAGFRLLSSSVTRQPLAEIAGIIIKYVYKDCIKVPIIIMCGIIAKHGESEIVVASLNYCAGAKPESSYSFFLCNPYNTSSNSFHNFTLTIIFRLLINIL